MAATSSSDSPQAIASLTVPRSEDPAGLDAPPRPVEVVALVVLEVTRHVGVAAQLEAPGEAKPLRAAVLVRRRHTVQRPAVGEVEQVPGAEAVTGARRDHRPVGV